MPEAGDAIFIDALRRLDLIGSDEAVSLTPLTGGVSSDIRLVAVGTRRFCAKRALPQLKVAQLWEVPTTRNAAEARYLRIVGGWLPGFVPQVLGEDAAAGLFAMAYLAPGEHPLWKSQLLAGVIDPAFAARVGAQLASVHDRSAADPAIRSAFCDDDMFEALRLDPYLRATARCHPDLAGRLHALADNTRATKRALVHGDVSPKNILVGPGGPVLLDAECAWFGDPAFDLAFCLNHLLLKGVRDRTARPRLAGAFRAMSNAYLGGVAWEPAAEVERRCAALLPALLLARVDGKSPVEYLDTDAQRDEVRRFARSRIVEPVSRLDALLTDWVNS
jgi:Phosphotransferase enzyme family